MEIHFATCDRQHALRFIQDVYPSRTITDSPDSAGPLLDFVESDVVRIQDPRMHGDRPEVIPGNNWNERYRADVIAACRVFHEKGGAK